MSIAEILMECPKCHSRKVIRYGKRLNRNVINQVYKCKVCNKKFSSIKTGLKRLELQHQQFIISAYQGGQSLRQMKKYLANRFFVRVDFTSIRNFLIKKGIYSSNTITQESQS